MIMMLRNALCFISVALLIGLPSCKTTASKASKDKVVKAEQKRDPILHFDTPIYDFGTIKLGDKPSYTYVFTNTSGEDLEIELVSGCHCTNIEWPENHVFKPEEKGEIKIIYNSELEDGLGEHNKTLDILLKKNDPKTGYQIIKEAKFKVLIEK